MLYKIKYFMQQKKILNVNQKQIVMDNHVLAQLKSVCVLLNNLELPVI